MGPYNDLAFGLHQAARFYYYPGWHEPGTCLEVIFNKDALAELPDDLRTLVLTAARAVNSNMLAEYTARNQQALDTLVNEHGVELRKFPDDVLRRLRALSEEVVEEIADRDPVTRKVVDSQRAFQAQVERWHDVSEFAFFKARRL